MNKDLSHGKPLKPYFQVARPAHYSFRTDLIDELCVADSMAHFLPRTGKQHETWLRISGLPAKEYPLVKMLPFTERPYAPTRRYVLQAVVLPGNSQYTNVVVDGTFEKGCRAIFNQYTPLRDRKTGLNPAFLGFINRNILRSDLERGQVLEKLQRYNLADIKDHDPMLNRELGSELEMRLAEIEKLDS